jgi:hypothetical protein
MASAASRFLALFNGLNRAYGIYIVPPPSVSGAKRAGDARTVQAPVNEALWARHLAGEIQLGIVPIRDDSTCVFGAIDVDDYSTDLKALGAKIRKMKLPLVVCRSKSGGAHLYAFFQLPTEATRVRELLAGWAASLGYASVEIFPKQDALHSTQDTGNWINMPYSGGAATERYALINGKTADIDAFLEYSEKFRVAPDTVNSTAEFPELLTEAPPCLVTLANGGIPDGQRNQTLFALAIYARKRWPEDWEEHVSELNANFVSPPLPSGEVSEVIKNVNKKDYNYPCKQEPLCHVCQRSICKNREFGVSAQRQVEEVGFILDDVSRIELTPVIYHATYAGKRVRLRAEQIASQTAMNVAMIEQAGIQMPPMKLLEYRRWVTGFLAKAVIVEGPTETAEGQQALYLLSQYCQRESPNRGWTNLIRGGSQKSNGRVYFAAQAFVSYVNRSTKGKNMSESDLWEALTPHGVLAESRPSKNGALSLWHLPAEKIMNFEEPTHDDTEL